MSIKQGIKKHNDYSRGCEKYFKEYSTQHYVPLL